MNNKTLKKKEKELSYNPAISLLDFFNGNEISISEISALLCLL
jgi:hypothetical protein